MFVRSCLESPRTKVVIAVILLQAQSVFALEHPHLLFSKSAIPKIKERAAHPRLKAFAGAVIADAEYVFTAPPLLVSMSARGEKDPPGERKGLDAARCLLPVLCGI
jgi:hypothetical protein